MFREVRTKVQLKLLPSSLSNVRTAVLRELSAMLLRIEPTLGGVPLSIKAMKIQGDTAAIFEDQPQIHITVAVTFLVFSPEKGSVICGVVNNIAEDTVGLLILNTFNAVISKEDMPNDFAINHDATSWMCSTTGDVFSVGSELRIRCMGMRTTDQGLIQVLAAFDSVVASAPVTSVAKPKKLKKAKNVPGGDKLTAAEVVNEPAGDAKVAAAIKKKAGAAEPVVGGEKRKKKKPRVGDE